MALIAEKYWRGEPLKAVIYFADDLVYTVYTDSNNVTGSNWINNATFRFSEGNNKVMPMGIGTSNKATLQIYDANDYLSPANIDSIYYGKVVNGVKVELFISYDGVEWSPYGVWYATNWAGGYSEGSHGVINVSLEDKLNTIGDFNLPELKAYANVQVADIIADVFNGIGIGIEEYSIDPLINGEMLYGVAQGIKVRDFLNNICQLLFARVIIDRAGVIRIVPALAIYSSSNELVLEPEDTGVWQNKNTNNIDYNAISVKYLIAGDVSRAQIFKDTNHSLIVGNNTISDITFKNKVLSVEQVKCLYDDRGGLSKIDSLRYEGYLDGIVLNIEVSGETIDECEIIGEGIVVSTTAKYINLDIANTSVIGGTTFQFDTKQMMTDEQAYILALASRDYISKVSRNLIMSDTALTPKLYIGDKVIVQNSNTMYDGVYKVIAMDMKMGEAYSLDLTFIRIL